MPINASLPLETAINPICSSLPILMPPQHSRVLSVEPSASVKEAVLARIRPTLNAWTRGKERNPLNPVSSIASNFCLTSREYPKTSMTTMGWPFELKNPSIVFVAGRPADFVDARVSNTNEMENFVWKRFPSLLKRVFRSFRQEMLPAFNLNRHKFACVLFLKRVFQSLLVDLLPTLGDEFGI